jgi:DinB superfamily
MNTQKWITRIEDVTQAAQKTFGSLSPDQLNWKPHSSVWSIAQNLDHLMVINATYFPIIESIRTGTYTLPWIARVGFMVTFFGNVVLDSVQPARKKKMKTFPLWQPSQSPLPPDLLARFTEAQHNLKKLIATSSDLLELRTIISSPANKNIVYTLETAFDIITVHEQRHMVQATDVLALLNQQK